MPPKSVTCSVCGESVLKSQTLAIGDGKRACRSHSDTMDASAKLQQDEKDRKARDQKIKDEKKKRRYRFEAPSSSDLWERARKFKEYANNHCWTCSCEGISPQEYYAQAIVALERLRMRDEFNFLTMRNDVHKLMGSPVVLHPIPYTREDTKLYRAIKDHRVRDILGLLRTVSMCPACIDKYEVRDRLAPPPEITPEQLEEGMVISSLIQPAVRALAEQKEKQN